MDAYFLKNHVIPPAAFGLPDAAGLRFQNARKQPLEEFVAWAVGRFRVRLGRQPVLVVVSAPLGAETVCGLPVRVEAGAAINGLELR